MPPCGTRSRRRQRGVDLSSLSDRQEFVGALRASARLYRRGLEANRPLDSVVAAFLKEDLKGTRRPVRGVVAGVVHAMWRRRRQLDALSEILASRNIPATTEALAMATLVLDARSRNAPTPVLPMERVDRDALLSAIDTLQHTMPPAVLAALPDWLFNRLEAIGGPSLPASAVDTPPQTLRVNTLKTTRDALMDTLQAEGIGTTACTLSEVGLNVIGHRDVFRTTAFHDGLFEVQDEGSQLVALHAHAKPGDFVIDGCAGAGGKSLALAAQMAGSGQLVALDIHAGRLRALKERARRAGAHNIRAINLEEDPKARKRLKGRADIVVVDAPCSGSGVLRRNPDTSWQLQRDDVTRLITVQASILDGYAGLVRPGGRLVYATCSLFPEENQAQVAAFIKRHPNFVPVDDDLHLRPDHDGTDGFFAAALTRKPEGAPT